MIKRLLDPYSEVPHHYREKLRKSYPTKMEIGAIATLLIFSFGISAAAALVTFASKNNSLASRLHLTWMKDSPIAAAVLQWGLLGTGAATGFISLGMIYLSFAPMIHTGKLSILQAEKESDDVKAIKKRIKDLKEQATQIEAAVKLLENEEEDLKNQYPHVFKTEKREENFDLKSFQRLIDKENKLEMNAEPLPSDLVEVPLEKPPLEKEVEKSPLEKEAEARAILHKQLVETVKEGRQLVGELEGLSSDMKPGTLAASPIHQKMNEFDENLKAQATILEKLKEIQGPLYEKICSMQKANHNASQFKPDFKEDKKGKDDEKGPPSGEFSDKRPLEMVASKPEHQNKDEPEKGGAA